jgi:hypothetical protein
MATLSIAPIVEGHGEVFAVPILLRRLCEHFAPHQKLVVHSPIRRSRDRLLLQGEFAARPDRTIRVALAHREYEAWFLAGIGSLAGRRGLEAQLVAPTDPESVHGAKEWLRRHMTGSRTYSETADQPALTALFDIDAARRSPSFDRLCRILEEVLTAI